MDATAKKYKRTLEKFIKSAQFAEAVIQSTKAGFGGSSYKVELLPDGTWMVLWANQIGNLYDSPGHIVTIPGISDSDYSDFEDMAGSGETDALTEQLRNTDELEEVAQEMRDQLHDYLAMYGGE
jgi:hypothetical protein